VHPQAARGSAHLLLGLAASIALAAPAQAQIGSELFAAMLSSPTYLTHAPGDQDRVFVIEQGGDIELFEQADGTPIGTFLTLPSVSGEGLQGLAFHPSYGSNGYFYVYYEDSGQTQVVRYSVSGDPDVADSGSAHTIIEIPQPAASHNGGWIGFGPDGYLYLPLGDGGSQNDPDDNGQDTSTLLGSVLRLDVDGDDFPGDPDRNYAIPSDNPFVGVAGEDEIWAYGLRNPFRCSFDRQTGDFYIADVGQAAREEIDFQPASSSGGENYGWRLREGTIATPTGGVGGPQPPDGVDPLYEYTHGTATNEGRSVTGGYVYRGILSSIQGKYFFGDYVSERIWSIEHDGANVTIFEDWTQELDPPDTTINEIVGFGEDAMGNLYIVDYGGQVFRIVSKFPAPSLGTPQLAALALAIALGGALVLGRRSGGGLRSPR